MTMETSARGWGLPMTVAVQRTRVQRIRDARLKVGIHSLSVSKNRISIADDGARLPDVDVVRVGVVCPELFWRVIYRDAAVCHQRCADPVLGDAQVDYLHPDGLECRDEHDLLAG